MQRLGIDAQMPLVFEHSGWPQIGSTGVEKPLGDYGEGKFSIAPCSLTLYCWVLAKANLGFELASILSGKYQRHRADCA